MRQRNGPDALPPRSSPATGLSLCIPALVGLTLMLALPHAVDLFTLLELTVYVIMAILALSLGMMWGYGGILCFGQAAFFGLGAYTYAIAVLNIGESSAPFLLAIIVPALFAALLGYFMFYGRVSDVYLGVITLTVTLILFKLFNSTAGPEYRIGHALIGGFNGIPSVPPLNIPGLPQRALSPQELFYLAMAVLLGVYFGLRWLLASHFGRVIVAIRENEKRAELLGYDVRWYKLLTFSLGGAIAGVAGCLYVNWGAFVSPTVFSLQQSAQIIIWVIVGGLGTLIGPVVGCVVVQSITAHLGTQQAFNSYLVLGAILLVFVLLVPRGLAPTIGSLGGRWLVRRRRTQSPVSESPTLSDPH